MAVYPTYSYANHSCVCNSLTRKHKDHRLELVAQDRIEEGQQIWTRYISINLEYSMQEEDNTFLLGIQPHKWEVYKGFQTYRGLGTSLAYASGVKIPLSLAP